MKFKQFKIVAAVAAQLVAGLVAVQAQTVSFTSGAITGASDVIATGGSYTVVEALQIGGYFSPPTGSAPAAIVNGVQFTQTDPYPSWPNPVVNGTYGNVTIAGVDGNAASGHYGPTNFSGSLWSGLNGGYQDILANGAFAQTTSDTIAITVGGLTSGNLYEVRFWEGLATYSGAETFSSGSSSSSAVSWNQNGATDPGYYVTASFVAGSDTQTFDITSADGGPLFSALEVVQVAVPEPSTVALMAAGAGLLCLTVSRRFRLAVAFRTIG